jgi:P2 family phage contractile tail tube protein
MSPASQILKNFNLYVDGRGFAGNVDEVQLPALTIIEEDYRAGGLDSSVSIDMGMEKLEATFKISSFDRDLIRLWGISNGLTVPLVVRGALESLDGTVKAIVVRIVGSIRSMEFDSLSPGAKASMSFKLSATSYKYEQDGEVLIEIDVLNMKRLIGGVDRLAKIRNAIGL